MKCTVETVLEKPGKNVRRQPGADGLVSTAWVFLGVGSPTWKE